MKVITRFAPSPTGYLHIGGARTALFNYLFAKHHNGKFLLRVEDTDKERSTDSAKKAIIDSLKWMKIDWDGEIIYQSERIRRHAEVAQNLLDNGMAYLCFESQEEIAKQREEAVNNSQHFIFKSKWRNEPPEHHPLGIKPVVRLKSPREGETIVRDQLQGNVITHNSHIDDMVLLRSDGTPTYMLAVVVDDHDMGITHIIRGDDHLTNAARQQVIYEALGWHIPEMIHISLIHGPDGSKLSKRHGALGTHEYRNLGYLPEALSNYLLKLGWSHGDDEFISREQAIKWFTIENLGKSPSRIDFDKMKHMNAHYIRELENYKVIEFITDNIEEVSSQSRRNLEKAIEDIKQRSKLLHDLLLYSKYYLDEADLEISDEAKEIIEQCPDSLIQEIILFLGNLKENTTSDQMQDEFKSFSEKNNMKLGDLMKYMRALVVGQKDTPSMFNLISIIGKEETIKRIKENIQTQRVLKIIDY